MRPWRQVSAVICLQRQFRSRMDRQREAERSERLDVAGTAAHSSTFQLNLSTFVGFCH